MTTESSSTAVDHIVVLTFQREDATEQELQEFYKGIETLKQTIPGVSSVAVRQNGGSQGFQHIEGASYNDDNRGAMAKAKRKKLDDGEFLFELYKQNSNRRTSMSVKSFCVFHGRAYETIRRKWNTGGFERLIDEKVPPHSTLIQQRIREVTERKKRQKKAPQRDETATTVIPPKED